MDSISSQSSRSDRESDHVVSRLDVVSDGRRRGERRRGDQGRRREMFSGKTKERHACNNVFSNIKTYIGFEQFSRAGSRRASEIASIDFDGGDHDRRARSRHRHQHGPMSSLSSQRFQLDQESSLLLGSRDRQLHRSHVQFALHLRLRIPRSLSASRHNAAHRSMLSLSHGCTPTRSRRRARRSRRHGKDGNGEGSRQSAGKTVRRLQLLRRARFQNDGSFLLRTRSKRSLVLLRRIQSNRHRSLVRHCTATSHHTKRQSVKGISISIISIISIMFYCRFYRRRDLCSKDEKSNSFRPARHSSQ